MAQTNPRLRFDAFAAYALSGLTSLLWVACVIPAGPLLDMHRIEETATPMYREAILLVPALFLLTLLPVGFTLARRTSGLTALLASTDAFVAIYAGLAFLIVKHPLDVPGVVCVALLFLLATLSGLEIWRSLSAKAGRPALAAVQGLRLALCLLILIVPSRFLLETGAERASWLGPFVLIALSAAGARLATTDRALRRTGALVQFLVAVHIAVTLRYTLLHESPLYMHLEEAGRVTLALAGVLVLFAAVQLFGLMRPKREAEPSGESVAVPGAG